MDRKSLTYRALGFLESLNSAADLGEQPQHLQKHEGQHEAASQAAVHGPAATNAKASQSVLQSTCEPTTHCLSTQTASAV